ncbi:MAG TPA: hypothetical protein VIY53_00835 [Acidobacteriaceae bacterium]
MSIQSRIAAALVFGVALAAPAQKLRQESYSWKNVQIVGGGFVDGILFHPTAPGVRYARTDIGGAYRWDGTAHRWQPILDWVPYKDLNLMGIESIAVDPSDPNRVYLACGTYTNPRTPDGAILRSDDRGRSFSRIDVPFKFGGNEDGRGNGERLVVDPNDGRVLFLGTRHDGLWRSADRGVTWTRVASFPDITEAVPAMPAHVPGETPEQFWRRMPVRGGGIVFEKFMPAAGAHAARTPSQNLYAGVSLMNRANLFVTHDGGATWSAVPGEPTQFRPTRAAFASDGFLYITYGTAPGPSRMSDGAVWKLDTRTGAWTDITPEHPGPAKPFGYSAVSVDAHHPQTVIVSTFGRPHAEGGDDIFRSLDGGATWRPVFTGDPGSRGVYDYSGAPYVEPTPIHWLFDIEIDPANPDHAVFTTGYGGWETHDLTAMDRGQPTHWSILATGIEETVALQLDSPAAGPHLISAIGDYGGFVHWSLDKPAPEGSSAPPRFGNTTGVASAALNPNIVVRVGISAEHKPGQNISYSLDAGRAWQGTVANPTAQARLGSIAVSADGSTWVWTPEREPPYVTRDHGATWALVQGLAPGTRVIADPQDPARFYALSVADRILYVSTDRAATFVAHMFSLQDASATPPATRGDHRGGQDQIYAAPGRTGDLWLAAWDGLYHLPPLGNAAGTPLALSRLPQVGEIHAFGFGKAAPGHPYPALYLVGTVAGQPGIFRSIDEAKSWVRINDDQHQWGLVLQVTGDPRVYGRVYVGTHGRGILYGDPVR